MSRIKAFRFHFFSSSEMGEIIQKFRMFRWGSLATKIGEVWCETLSKEKVPNSVGQNAGMKFSFSVLRIRQPVGQIQSGKPFLFGLNLPRNSGLREGRWAHFHPSSSLGVEPAWFGVLQPWEIMVQRPSFLNLDSFPYAAFGIWLFRSPASLEIDLWFNVPVFSADPAFFGSLAFFRD